MNKRLITIFIYTCILFLGVSCRFQDKKVKPVLERAEALLETHPDSALVILNEIANPQSLRKSLYYEYFLLQIQAKYKSDKDITADTLIFTIRDYYRDRDKPEETALATFYSGRVYQEQNKLEEALQQYLDTEQLLKQSQDFNLKGLCQSAIGNIYYQQLLDDKAIGHYKTAMEYFHQAENYRNQIICIRFTGNCFLITGKTDSAFLYYEKGLYLADKYGVESQQIEVRQSLGVAYREIEKWKQSQTFFEEALAFSKDSLNKARLFANLAKLFVLQDKNELAIFHLQEAINYIPTEQNNHLAANIYNTWTSIEENQGNYRNALDKNRLYNKYLAEIIYDNKNTTILELEEKYNFQLIENRNKQLLIERQRILLIFLFAILVLGLLIFRLLKRSQKNKKQLEETEKKVRQLNKLAKSFDDKEESFRNVLIQHFGIIKKAALLEGYLKEDERKKGQSLLRKFNEVVYGRKKLNWNVLYKTLNKLNNGFFDEFKNQFPQLDESEFRICCLMYVDFNNTEIAILLNYSINTVQAKRTLIRKKLGIKTYGNICDFMSSATKN
ncbi:hypothetical protein [uncultured Draconibacterium sp.]|uniref:tetratricopeptide repeat protein n=1 Tax=uncultured Draconibacterium sp. TaxID=1573823 RepID=UPI002603F1C8|nr:hypothetical protein [uncultured Draconibacterium sp.]